MNIIILKKKKYSHTHKAEFEKVIISSLEFLIQDILHVNIVNSSTLPSGDAISFTLSRESIHKLCSIIDAHHGPIPKKNFYFPVSGEEDLLIKI